MAPGAAKLVATVYKGRMMGVGSPPAPLERELRWSHHSADKKCFIAERWTAAAGVAAPGEKLIALCDGRM